jgi:alpha-aminoadipate/glutamate carrier protein LysW
MMNSCPECVTELKIPSDAIDGEIVTCQDCGSSWEVEISSEGTISLKQAESVGEDWGE